MLIGNVGISYSLPRNRFLRSSDPFLLKHNNKLLRSFLIVVTLTEYAVLRWKRVWKKYSYFVLVVTWLLRVFISTKHALSSLTWIISMNVWNFHRIIIVVSFFSWSYSRFYVVCLCSLFTNTGFFGLMSSVVWETTMRRQWIKWKKSQTIPVWLIFSMLDIHSASQNIPVNSQSKAELNPSVSVSNLIEPNDTYPKIRHPGDLVKVKAFVRSISPEYSVAVQVKNLTRIYKCNDEHVQPQPYIASIINILPYIYMSHDSENCEVIIWKLTIEFCTFILDVIYRSSICLADYFILEYIGL